MIRHRWLRDKVGGYPNPATGQLRGLATYGLLGGVSW